MVFNNNLKKKIVVVCQMTSPVVGVIIVLNDLMAYLDPGSDIDSDSEGFPNGNSSTMLQFHTGHKRVWTSQQMSIPNGCSNHFRD